MTIYRSLFRLNFLFFLVVGLLVIICFSYNLTISDLFFFPYFNSNPTVAFLTRTFQILCSVPVVVCAFSYAIAKSLYLRHPETRFILFSAILTGAFLLNEIYRIHVYAGKLGIPKLGVSFLYAIGLFSYGWFFRRELKQTPYQILLAGLGLLFVAIGIDALHLKTKIVASLLEGVPKLFSEINIAFYYWYVCKCFIEKIFRKQLTVDN